MPKSFEPRRVPPSSSLAWCQEAVLLSARHFIRNTLLLLAFCAPYLLLSKELSNWHYLIYLLYNLICPPTLFALLVHSAHCSDYSTQFAPSLLSRQFLVGLGKTILFYILVLLGVILLACLLYLILIPLELAEIDDVSAGASHVKKLIQPDFLAFFPGERLAWGLGIYLFFGAITWFIAPLMTLLNCPFDIGVKLAFRALVLNRFLFWLPLGVLILLMLLTQVSGVLAIPAGVWIGMLVYVSFRDIFLGRRKSFPVPKQTASDLVVSHHHS